MCVSRETLYHRENAKLVAKALLTELKVNNMKEKRRSPTKAELVGDLCSILSLIAVF